MTDFESQNGRIWLHPCPTHKAWVTGRPNRNHPHGTFCKKGYKWKPLTGFLQDYFCLGASDRRWLTLQRKAIGYSVILAVEAPRLAGGEG